MFCDESLTLLLLAVQEGIFPDTEQPGHLFWMEALFLSSRAISKPAPFPEGNAIYSRFHATLILEKN